MAADGRNPKKSAAPQRPEGEGHGKQSGPPRAARNSMGWFFLLVLFGVMLLLVQAIGPHREEVTWSQFEALYAEGNLHNDERHPIYFGTDGITAVRKADSVDGAEKRVWVAVGPTSREPVMKDLKALTNGSFKDRTQLPMWLMMLNSPLLWTVLFIVLIWFFIMRGLRSAGGAGGVLGNFGKSRHRLLAKESTGITFNDVAGIDDAKEEVREIVEFLKNPKKFMKLGGRIPRGVLLTGEPGCGKTLLAKAIAGEADVPFFSISGSDFVEMFVGVGASRVRDLFKQAKDSSPCIIFLDEIDAVGRRRGGGFTTGGHDEREQTLNAILVEMDGFDSSDQVIVIAATNRPDVLDPALTRPGRFDRQVVVSLPDIKGRLEILRVHSKKIKMGPAVDLERIARGTPMFSGAELAAFINEAAISATLTEKDYVEQSDLEEARDKVRYGRSRKSRVFEEKERIATAYHEAGHAILQALLPDVDPLHKVTIIPRGQSLGSTFSLPEKDRYGFGLKWLRATARLACGGRIAEEIKTGDISSGATGDIQQLTTLSRAMVLDWGMSEKLGFVRYSGVDNKESFIPEREYSEETARIIDEEIRRFSREAYEDARRIIEQNWEKVVAVAEALLKYEVLSADEVHRLMRGEALGKPTVSEMIAAENRRKQQTPTVAPPSRGEADGLGPGLVAAPA